MDTVITTIQKPSAMLEHSAHTIANLLHLPFVERLGNSLDNLKQTYNAHNVIVMTKSGPVVHTAGGEYFFHLSMAELRIKNILNGKPDHMISSMALCAGMSVLDCTLGLATDAIVASFITGNTGRVVGLEASAIIAFVAQYGLQHLETKEERITDALRHIAVINEDFNNYLFQLPEKSFDIVYFDPMFRQPVYSSSNLKPLRYLADTKALTKEALHQASRVAKHRVVIKEANHSREFERLGIKTISGGKYSSVCYGIIEVGN